MTLGWRKLDAREYQTHFNKYHRRRNYAWGGEQKLNPSSSSEPAIFKNSGKYGPGLSCRWFLFTAQAFGFKLHLIWYSIWWIFMVDIDAFRVFMRSILNIGPYSQLKPTKVGFIFTGPNSFCRAEHLAAVNHVTQAVVRVGLKIGS